MFANTYLSTTAVKNIEAKSLQDKQKLSAKIAAFALISHLEKNFPNLTLFWLGKATTNYDAAIAKGISLNEAEILDNSKISRFHCLIITNPEGLRLLIDLGSLCSTIVTTTTPLNQFTAVASYTAHQEFAKQVLNNVQIIERAKNVTSNIDISEAVENELIQIIENIVTSSSSDHANHTITEDNDKTTFILKTTEEHFSWVALPDDLDFSIILDGYGYVIAMGDQTTVEDKHLYFKISNCLEYTVKNPQGVVVTDRIDLKSIFGNSNIDTIKNGTGKIQPFLSRILSITTARGHTQPSPAHIFVQALPKLSDTLDVFDDSSIPDLEPLTQEFIPILDLEQAVTTMHNSGSPIYTHTTAPRINELANNLDSNENDASLTYL